MSGFVDPVSLTGQRWVKLEPLGREHIPEIAAAAADGELGKLWFTAAPAPEDVEQWVDRRLAVQKPDEGLTFVVRRLDGTFVGSSSYLGGRRAQPAAGDRQYLVRGIGAAQRGQRRDQTLDARPRVR